MHESFVERWPTLEFTGTALEYFASSSGPGPHFETVDWVGPNHFVIGIVFGMAGEELSASTEERLLFRIQVVVPVDVPVGTVIPIFPTNGPAGDGLGEYRFKNELPHLTETMIVARWPRLVGGAIHVRQPFVRGDSNGDGKPLDLSDGVYILQYLFAQGPELPCMDAADANDDGAVNLADGIYSLQNLFASGPAIPPPYPECGIDPTVDVLGCASYEPCEQ
jgi:hypothetical protein